MSWICADTHANGGTYVPLRNTRAPARLIAECTPLARVHATRRLRVQLTFVVGWGGGLTSAIVLARPLELPINLFSKRHDLMIVGVWWLANYFPGGLPGKLLRTKPMRIVSLLLTQICRAGTMCLVMSLVAKYHPDSTIGVIVMGAPPAVCGMHTARSALPATHAPKGLPEGRLCMTQW